MVHALLNTTPLSSFLLSLPLSLSLSIILIFISYKPPSGLLFSTPQAFRTWRGRGWTWGSHLAVWPRWCRQPQSGRPHSRRSRGPYTKRRGEPLPGQLYLDSSSSRVARLSRSSYFTMLEHSGSQLRLILRMGHEFDRTMHECWHDPDRKGAGTGIISWLSRA